jgi:hypothetical protein
MKICTGFVSAVTLLVSAISVPLGSADVVEVRNGRRVEGAFEGADDTTGMVIASDGLAALWSCASDRLAAAERLCADRKR